MKPAATGRQRLCVVGTGIAGLLAARLLALRHDVTVFEREDRIGGHTHTVDVEVGGERQAIDTGFIVHNERNYPNFVRLLRQLGVATLPTTMSFSLRCERTGLEYCGSSLNQLFAQRRNLLRPRFWGMVADILRFFRQAPLWLQQSDQRTLGELLAEHRYGRAFREQFLVPMGAAIWSSEPGRLLGMPASFFLRFFLNHGMLQLRNRPQWRVLVGGSRRYLEPLAAAFADRIRCGAAVVELRRTGAGVAVRTQDGDTAVFDGAVVATHSDQALRLLGDPTDGERAVLGTIPYQENEVVLHTDTSLLPRSRRAWAAWNYHIPRQPLDRVAVTYCMNLLQGLRSRTTFCVTLNRSDAIDPKQVLRRFVYHHPVFDQAAVSAQQQVPALNGSARVWYCGAWCGYGFHEDGVVAALRVAADFGLGLDDLDTAAHSHPVAIAGGPIAAGPAAGGAA